MAFHGRQGATETVKFNRIPSPLSYIQNYNRLCNEEDEQTKASLQIDKKHKDLFLWNDGYVALNKIVVPNAVEEFKVRRKGFESPRAMSESDEDLNSQYQQVAQPQQQMQLVETYRSLKQQREKQHEKDLAERTISLAKMIEQNNRKQYSIRQTNKNSLIDDLVVEGLPRSAAGQVDTNQRKYFSQTKQQMLELQNHLLNSQKISREIMDRKGLSLRKVLSSIPQDKLMEIIDNKQYHFKKIVNEKIQPKKEFRLKSRLSPRFTGEYNYDFHRPTTTKSSHQAFQGTGTGFSTARSKASSQQKSACSSKRPSQYQLTTQNDQDLPPVNNFQHSKSQNFTQAKTPVGNLQKQTAKDSEKGSQDSVGLYYLEEMQLDFGLNEEKETEVKDKKKEMRIKSLHEVKKTMDRFKLIQDTYQTGSNFKDSTNQETYTNLDREQCLESVSFKPKTSLETILQLDDLESRQILISSLEQKKRETKKKNFFNYNNYFHGKYSSKNTGLGTKLSINALQENSKFESDLQAMIKQIDFKNPAQKA